MEKREIVDFVIGLYRLTLLFPKKEPLRYKIREIADEILANFLRITNLYEYTDRDNQNPMLSRLRRFTEIRPLEIWEDLEILDSFLEVAKNQNWIAPGEILKFQEKLPKIREALAQKEKTAQFPGEGQSLKFRQEKILEILREKGKVQVGELKKIFPQVSKRTLRRDFGQLVRQGLIERMGEKNKTFYKIKEYDQSPEKI